MFINMSAILVNFKRKSQIHIHVSYIHSIALYGGETWTHRKIFQKNLERFLVLEKVAEDQLV
jgi:hypothetical protein